MPLLTKTRYSWALNMGERHWTSVPAVLEALYPALQAIESSATSQPASSQKGVGGGGKDSPARAVELEVRLRVDTRSRDVALVVLRGGIAASHGAHGGSGAELERAGNGRRESKGKDNSGDGSELHYGLCGFG